MKINTFTLEGRIYKAAPFDYNLICDLDDMGVSLQDAKDKPNSFMRAYVALSTGMSKAEAGKAIEKLIIEGTGLESIADAMSAEMEASDFFRSLQKKTDEETQTDSEEEKKKSK